MTAYPDTPGFKERGATSQEAAGKIGSTAKARDMALRELKASPDGLTADEIAAKMGLSILYVRPRVSELVGLGLVAKTQRRRQNSSGQSAAVMIAAPMPPPVKPRRPRQPKADAARPGDLFGGLL